MKPKTKIIDYDEIFADGKAACNAGESNPYSKENASDEHAMWQFSYNLQAEKNRHASGEALEALPLAMADNILHKINTLATNYDPYQCSLPKDALTLREMVSVVAVDLMMVAAHAKSDYEAPSP